MQQRLNTHPKGKGQKAKGKEQRAEGIQRRGVKSIPYKCKSVDRSEQLPLLLEVGGVSVARVDLLGQRSELAQCLLQGGVVGVRGRRVLEEVAKEEHVAWDSLDWLDQEVVEGEPARVVPRPLLHKVGERGCDITLS